MKLIKSTSPIMDLVFGILFSLLGLFIIFNRKKLIDALILSSKIFWEKLGFSQIKEHSFLTTVMILIIGILFLTIGIVLIYRVICK